MTAARGRDLTEAFDASIDDLPDSVDRDAVERMRSVAYVLDESVRVPGTDFRVGVDPLVSAVPVVGDALGVGLSLYVVLEAARLGVSYTTLVEMLANVTIDAVGGSVPVVGDVFDAVWKANKRNLELVLDDLTDADEDEWTSVEVTRE
ncbi:hypothetical protein GCM10009037_03820 [Halarchaeum grantii]|uniref:DUF4112 domain-containing protein n=1 Tax=Halarchaeum grantii TaxID=1193105 RepID=A0A830F692_9EURY|nr:DUF4112 domain-containing protein [Halarchaeum grantii]GGL23504.1 hypothetical protein GCM10009037_03820 [Halarchaeum grantii]